jgi:hypothetical protein
LAAASVVLGLFAVACGNSGSGKADSTTVPTGKTCRSGHDGERSLT